MISPSNVFVGTLLLLLAGTAFLRAETQVVAQKTPFDGKRAKAFTDRQGNVHLTFNNQGNIFYTVRKPNEDAFSQPIQVNSIAKSGAISELAVGRDGHVHVVYHGNIFYIREQIKGENRKLQGSDIKYTFYSRLKPGSDAFEEQRDLSGGVWGFDGGCAIAADGKGHVYIFMGGTKVKGKETDRKIFLRRSDDDGETFSEPRPIDLGKGVCMCCHLKAQSAPNGDLMLAYRVAEDSVNRDSYVLTSKDLGKSFQSQVLDHWELRACPGSAYSFVNLADDQTLVSWRNQDEVYFGVNGEKAISPPEKKLKRRVAVLGNNQKGETLLAWVEGENFNKPHHLRWQLYDKEGKTIGKPGFKKHVFKRWGSAAVFARGNGDFVILH